MIANPPAYRPDPSGPVICAWPEDAAYISGQFAGFVMPRVDTREAVTIPDLAASRATTWRERVAVAENLTRAVAVLHDRDVVIGDFRKWNLLTWSDSRVTLLGCDRMQVVDPESGRRFPSVAGRDACTPPELQLPATLSSTIRTSSSDIFGLALHLHLLLLQGAHPFQGQWTGGGDSPPEHLLAQEGLWAYAGDRRLDPCPGSAPLTVLPATLQQYFRAAFVDGARNPDTRPPAQDWLNELLRLRESLVTCAVEPTHSYGRHLPSCPWCPGSPSRAGSTPPGYIPRQASPRLPPPQRRYPSTLRPAPGTPRPCRRGNPPRTTGAAEPGHAIRHTTPGVHSCSPPPQRAPPGSVGSYRRGRHRRRRRGEHGVAPSRTPRTRPHGFGTSAHHLDTAAAPRPADPTEALEQIRAQDAPVVDTLADSWVPQLSTRPAGTQSADRTAMDAAILAGHDALRNQHPGAVLLRSTDWNYDGRFWITVMNERFPTAEEANTWCDTNRFAPQDCFAKKLSHTGVVEGSTRYRT